MAVAVAARAIPLALFSFNGGVELGQLLFVVVALAGTAVLDLLPVRWLEAAALIPAYAIGSLSAYWFFTRASLVFFH